LLQSPCPKWPAHLPVPFFEPGLWFWHAPMNIVLAPAREHRLNMEHGVLVLFIVNGEELADLCIMDKIIQCIILLKLLRIFRIFLKFIVLLLIVFGLLFNTVTSGQFCVKEFSRAMPLVKRSFTL
jgi:hypothetical protein